jgi:hypothetical protein
MMTLEARSASIIAVLQAHPDGEATVVQLASVLGLSRHYVGGVCRRLWSETGELDRYWWHGCFLYRATHVLPPCGGGSDPDAGER